MLPKHKRAMDQHFKAKWQKAESDLKALCQSSGPNFLQKKMPGPRCKKSPRSWFGIGHPYRMYCLFSNHTFPHIRSWRSFCFRKISNLTLREFLSRNFWTPSFLFCILAWQRPPIFFLLRNLVITAYHFQCVLILVGHKELDFEYLVCGFLAIPTS